MSRRQTPIDERPGSHGAWHKDVRRVALGELLEPERASAGEFMAVALLSVRELSDRSRAKVQGIASRALRVPVWADCGRDYALSLYVRLVLDDLFDADLSTVAVLDVVLPLLALAPGREGEA